jgi:glutaminase-like protein
MPNPNSLVDRVSGLSTSKESLAAMAGQPTPQTVTVSFESGRSGVLDVSVPRAVVWAKMLSSLRERNRPAYVEIDPDTGTISQIAIPEASRVMAIAQDDSGDLRVNLVTSQAVHYLRASNPDFEEFRAALESARDGGSEVLVTGTLHRHEIVDVRPLPKAPEPEAPSAAAPAPAPEWAPQAVTPERAEELFDLMKARSCDCGVVPPCIPFKYPPDGCYARAHEMCRLMFELNEDPEKVWIYGSLEVNTANEPYDCHVSWWYHVAPTLLVTQPGGPEKVVIDPSLCNGPVSPAGWKALQGDPSATLEHTHATKFWPNGGTDPDYSQTEYYLQQKRDLLEDWCETYGAPPYSCPINKKCSFITDRSTFGEDEITSMLQNASPAVIESAFYIVLDGYSPWELGITSFDPPNVKPTFAESPPVPGMSIAATHLAAAHPSYPQRRQRLTWTCKVEFANITAFTSSSQTVELTASVGGESAKALIYLIAQPNPYEIDGPVSWLSTDLRVFQIKEGESRFAATMGSTPAAASAFIKQVISNLNAGASGGQTFDSIPTHPQTAQLELSKLVNGARVFNFALAKVRYRSTDLEAQNVRVFFRLFPVSSTSTKYQPSTAYRTGGQSGAKIPLLGIQNGQLATIPCFAEPRVDSATTQLTQQTDPANVKTIPPTGGAEHDTYFGCWLDINQTQGQFPIQPSPADGPFTSGRKTIQELIHNQHQCLVAEIAFDPDPIPSDASPAMSDKLAQRNLAIVESANPGGLSSRRIPLTFEIEPTPADLKPGEPPDELMIHWGNTPAGSRATLYLPGLNVSDVVEMAEADGNHSLEQVDEHTLQCRASGATYVPISPEAAGNYAGLLTVDLPPKVHKGQEFTIVVRQLTNAEGKPPIVIESPSGVESEAGAASVAPLRWRKVLGSFQLTIPVHTKEVILEPEVRLLSVLRWIRQSIPENDRWHRVFERYVEQTAGRVDALGGYSDDVLPSPSGVDVTLRLRILDPQGEYFGKPVDIDVKHRTLASAPRQRFRRVVPSNVFLVKELRRFPQSDYIVTVTPSDWFDPEGQFVTIPASGAAELIFVIKSSGGGGGTPPPNDVTMRLRILDPYGQFFGKPVDIDIKHRTLASEPGQEFRGVVASDIIAVMGLRRFPQSDYVVTVTPSDKYHPNSQFVTIPASGFASLVFVLKS